MLIDKYFVKNPTVKRHIAKTITWRIVGSVDTMLLGWIITGNPVTGIQIGGLEVITKMALYFFHERIWYRINFGLPQRKKADKENQAEIISNNH